MSPIPPRTSGIYQIRCIPTGKIYVGSAVDIRLRWHAHRSALRRGEHANEYLQYAWEKYGEENFEFSILEFVDKTQLILAEQEWLDRTNCVDRDAGFNICRVAGSQAILPRQQLVPYSHAQANQRRAEKPQRLDLEGRR